MIKRFRSLVLLLFPLFCVGCAHSVLTSPPMDFSHFVDAPIPVHVLTWLEGEAQSILSPRVASMARKIGGKNRRECLYRATLFVSKNLPYDLWHNEDAFRRTADEVLERGVLGGCSDFALVQIALFRALGIPSRMVVTASVDWVHQFRANRIALTEGHCFIEVYLEDRWFLFDSTYRYVYHEYDPERSDYPHGEVLGKRGRDFWDMGIRDIRDFDNLMRDVALSYEGVYVDPGYPRYPF